MPDIASLSDHREAQSCREGKTTTARVIRWAQSREASLSMLKRRPKVVSSEGQPARGQQIHLGGAAGAAALRHGCLEPVRSLALPLQPPLNVNGRYLTAAESAGKHRINNACVREATAAAAGGRRVHAGCWRLEPRLSEPRRRLRLPTNMPPAHPLLVLWLAAGHQHRDVVSVEQNLVQVGDLQGQQLLCCVRELLCCACMCGAWGLSARI